VEYNSAPSLCIRGVDRVNSAFCPYLTFRFSNLRAISKVKSRGCEQTNRIRQLHSSVMGVEHRQDNDAQPKPKGLTKTQLCHFVHPKSPMDHPES